MAKKPPESKRSGKQVSVYVDPEIREALDAYVDQAEPTTTLTAVVELALRRYLKSVGYWPPPDQSES